MTKIFLLHTRDNISFLIATQFMASNNVVKNFYRLAGFPGNPTDHIQLTLADTMESHASPHAWDSISMVAVHKFIIDNFDEIESGDSIDEDLIMQSEKQKHPTKEDLSFNGFTRKIVEAESKIMEKSIFNDKTIFDYHNENEEAKKELIFSEPLEDDEDSIEVPRDSLK